jgi:hypothetical protein
LYELNWQSGYLKNIYNNAVAPINVESDMIFPADVNGNDSALGPWGFGVENIDAGQSASIEPNQIAITTTGVGTAITSTGVTFPDATVQVTAYDPAVLNDYIPIVSQDNRHITREITTPDNNDTAGYLNIGSNSSVGQDGCYIKLSSNDAGGQISIQTNDTDSFIKFKDNTTQNTAYDPAVLNDYIPFTSSGTNSITRTTKAPNEDDTGIFSVGGYDNPAVSVGAFVKLTNVLGAGEIAFIADEVEGTFLKFSDASKQFTAFPPAGGLVTEYITGTGTLVTFPAVGDRYFTTSNSTLTCDSGNGKTMTIGTGLSYSRQQDITVSYDNSNHMHGTVLTYDSATGVMTFDSNTHSGDGTYSSWEVNVGGVAGAVLPVGGTSGQVLAKINSTNFNTEWKTLGTMSTEPASAYLSTASAVANYQTLAGMSAYLSTSAASSTYLTQSNASSTYLTQANASTTYIGTSAYATTAQAEAMTSTSTVLSPARFRDAYFTANVTKPNTSTWLTATTGTGGLNDGGNGDFRRLQGPTSAANTIVRASHVTNYRRGGDFNSNIDWTKYNALYFRLRQNGADTNSTFIITLGEDSNGAGNADPAGRCVGIKFNYGGVVKILAHNGTTLVQPSTSYTPSTLSGIDFLIVSDGSGTIEVFANGTSIGTTTGGPTTLLAGTAQQQCINARVFNNSTPSGTQLSVYIGGVTAYTS